LAAFDAQGCLWSERFIQGKIPVMYAYDNGYAGYSLRAEPTFATMSGSRQFKENAIIHYIKEQMRHALEADKSLSPPLELLKNTCQQQGVDFADICLDYLTLWDQQ